MARCPGAAASNGSRAAAPCRWCRRIASSSAAMAAWIGPVRRLEPFLELGAADRPAPEIAVRWVRAGTIPRPPRARGPIPRTRRIGDDRGVDLVLAAVAVDRSARRAGDDRAAAELDRAPHQPIDQRIFERAGATACPSARDRPASRDSRGREWGTDRSTGKVPRVGRTIGGGREGHAQTCPTLGPRPLGCNALARSFDSGKSRSNGA